MLTVWYQWWRWWQFHSTFSMPGKRAPVAHMISNTYSVCACGLLVHSDTSAPCKSQSARAICQLPWRLLPRVPSHRSNLLPHMLRTKAPTQKMTRPPNLMLRQYSMMSRLQILMARPQNLRARPHNMMARSQNLVARPHCQTLMARRQNLVARPHCQKVMARHQDLMARPQNLMARLLLLRMTSPGFLTTQTLSWSGSLLAIPKARSVQLRRRLVCRRGVSL